MSITIESDGRLSLAMEKFRKGQDELIAALAAQREARREAREALIANGATIRFISVARAAK